MGRFASGKKSFGTSDITGFRVRYPKLRTTWNNLRVEPEEFDIKHPQLTPAKNIFDATALRDPRPDNDAEPVTIFLNYNWLNTNTTSLQGSLYRKPELPSAKGSVGFVTFEISELPTGIAGTGAIGTEAFELSIDEAGVAGTGALGSTVPTIEVSGVSGSAGVGAVGVEALSLSILESGVAGTGAVGTEVPEASITESGVAGTGATGTEDPQIDETFWGSGDWNEGAWGQ